jgi:hypothetical protein
MRHPSARRRRHFLGAGANQTTNQFDVSNEFSNLRLDVECVSAPNCLGDMQSQTGEQLELGESANHGLQLSIAGTAEQDAVEDVDIPVNEHAFPWNQHVVKNCQ